MIKKVAIGQGFRLCFPTELGGLPYLREEIMQGMENGPVVGADVEDDDTPTTEPTTDAPKEETQETAPAQPEKKPLISTKVKEVQEKWKSFADLNGWDTETSDRKKKATMQEYYSVSEVVDLVESQANSFIGRIDLAIEKFKKDSPKDESADDAPSDGSDSKEDEEKKK